MGARFEIQAEAFERQARGASKMAEQLMDDNKAKEDKKKSGGDEAELKALKTKLSEAVAAKDKAELDLDVLKQQNAATNREYDRLMSELDKLQAAGSKND